MCPTLSGQRLSPLPHGSHELVDGSAVPAGPGDPVCEDAHLLQRLHMLRLSETNKNQVAFLARWTQGSPVFCLPGLQWFYLLQGFTQGHLLCNLKVQLSPSRGHCVLCAASTELSKQQPCLSLHLLNTRTQCLCKPELKSTCYRTALLKVLPGGSSKIPSTYKKGNKQTTITKQSQSSPNPSCESRSRPIIQGVTWNCSLPFSQ